jgi:hypothetical protein
MKMVRLVNEITEEGVKIIVLGDAETNGSAYAQATVIFPKEKELTQNSGDTE